MKELLQFPSLLYPEGLWEQAHLCSSPMWPQGFGCWQGKVMNVSPCPRGMVGIIFLLLLQLVQSQSKLLVGHLPLCWLTGLQLFHPHRNWQSWRSPRTLSFTNTQRRKLGPTVWCTKCCRGLCSILALTVVLFRSGDVLFSFLQRKYGSKLAFAPELLL